MSTQQLLWKVKLLILKKVPLENFTDKIVPMRENVIKYNGKINLFLK